MPDQPFDIEPNLEHVHVDEIWLDPGREVWERQPNETLQAYRAFSIYRDMGIGRSVRAAAEYARKQQRNNSETAAEQQRNSGEAHTVPQRRLVPRHWFLWSKKFNWIQRVHYYDSFMDEQRLREQKLAQNQHAAARAERRQRVQTVYEKFVENFLTHVETTLPAALPAPSGSPGQPVAPAFSPYHLARLVRELREFESALQWGFPKLTKSK